MNRFLSAAVAVVTLIWAGAANAAVLAHFTSEAPVTLHASGDYIEGSGVGTFQFLPEAAISSLNPLVTDRFIPVSFSFFAPNPTGSEHALPGDFLSSFTMTYIGADVDLGGGLILANGSNILSGYNISGRFGDLSWWIANARVQGFLSSDYADDLSNPTRGSVLTIKSNGKYDVTEIVFVSTVPEPATWAMMIIGFGLAGTGLRSARSQPQAQRRLPLAS